VTDSHFSHITHIRIFVANRAFRAGITRAHASGSRITDLITGTEQSVVRTCRIVGGVHTGVIDLVAGIHGTADAVIAVGRRTRLAGAGSGITGLRTVAELAVVTLRVDRALGLRLAYSVCWVTLLTGRTCYWRIDASRYWIAAIGCAQVPIVAIKWCTGLTGAGSTTELRTVADVVVVALCVNCAFGCCAVWIGAIGRQVAVIVEAHACASGA
jgi:hypothetical protein